ncbi:MAG: hypothetical protein ACK5M7_05400 [Draconibacterium sp.]
MNNLIAGFIGPQEIVIIGLGFFILLPVFIIFIVIHFCRKNNKNKVQGKGESIVIKREH